MASAQEPFICETTGRLLTEWFEHPEYTDEQLEQQALDHYGVTEKPRCRPDEISDQATLMRQINGFVAGRKRRRFPNNMNAQEVQARLNEASKMVSPDNFKFLPDEVRERTGLEVNPLWLMECIIRSGLLSAKEQLAGLKELAAYTHSKAPSINHNTNTEMSPEDWLVELAKDEYKVIGTDIELKERLQPVEAGMGKKFAKIKAKKIEAVQSYESFGNAKLAELEAIMDAELSNDDS